MWTWVLRAGANLAPYAYGWVSNDLWNWFDSADPDKNKEDAFAIGGWGISVILLAIAGFLAWDKWGK